VRAGRLVELLALLQARGRMTARQLARELEVSPRTIIRDMEALSSAGFGIYAVRGSLGGFELLPGPGIELPAASPHLRATRPGGQRARIRISPRGRQLATLNGRPAGLRVRRPGRATGPGGRAEAWLPLSSLAVTAADILALGGEAEVIEPAELRELVLQTALRVAQVHRDAPA
jgi:predicted DNA-binding transcriptional regulator YafY